MVKKKNCITKPNEPNESEFDLQLNVCIQKMSISIGGIVQVQCDRYASSNHGAVLFPFKQKQNVEFNTDTKIYI